MKYLLSRFVSLDGSLGVFCKYLSLNLQKTNQQPKNIELIRLTI